MPPFPNLSRAGDQNHNREDQPEVDEHLEHVGKTGTVGLQARSTRYRNMGQRTVAGTSKVVWKPCVKCVRRFSQREVHSLRTQIVLGKLEERSALSRTGETDTLSRPGKTEQTFPVRERLSRTGKTDAPSRPGESVTLSHLGETYVPEPSRDSHTPVTHDH